MTQTEGMQMLLQGEDRVERIRALAGGGLGAWREAQTTGALAEHGPRRAALLQGLVRRWHAELDEQLEAVAEREAPGPRRARLLAGIWLERMRTTAGVRAALAADGVDLRAAAPLRGLLAQDGPDADALVQRLAAVAAQEDAAGRVLRRARRDALDPRPWRHAWVPRWA